VFNWFPSRASVHATVNHSESIEDALRRDWETIGKDLKDAMDKDIERRLLEKRATCALCKAPYEGGKHCAKCGWHQFRIKEDIIVYDHMDGRSVEYRGRSNND